MSKELTLWFDDFADAQEALAAVSNSSDVKTVRRAHGEEGVTLKDGTSIRLRTKTTAKVRRCDCNCGSN